MTWDEFDAWSPHSVRGHAAQAVASGFRPEAEALAEASRQLDEQLPHGIASHLQLLHTVRADVPGRPTVGHLWLRVRPRASEVEAYLMDVEIEPGRRGLGYGRAAVLAAERLARDLGATVLRLNVFGHNTTAIALYDDLGLTVTSATLTAPLPRPLDADDRLRLRPLADAEVEELRARRTRTRASELVRAEALAPGEALRLAEDDLLHALPGPTARRAHLLLAAHDAAGADASVDPVGTLGTLWIELERLSDGTHAVLRDLWTAPGEQRPERARALVLAALAASADRGASSLRATWSEADGASARGVYDRLGFVLTAQTMEKSWAAPAARR